MVVVYHLIHAEHVYGGGTTLLGGAAHFGFAGVDVFFVISGFIMAKVTAGRFGSTVVAMDFLGRRALRIFPLYWLCTAAIALALNVRPGSLDPGLAEKSILQSLLLLPQEGGPLLVVGWTLTYELFFYTATAFSLVLRSRSRVPLLILAWAALLLLMQALPAQNPWSILLTSPLAFEFIAGAIAGMYWHRLPDRQAWTAIACGLGWMIAAGILLSGHPVYGQADGIRTIAFGLPSALLVAGFARLEATGRIKPPHLAVMLGDASYSLYLTHLFVLSVSGRVWAAFGATGTNVGNATFVISTFIACCGVALLVHRFVERPITSIGNRAWVRRAAPGLGSKD